jgi:fructuronate reductase
MRHLSAATLQYLPPAVRRPRYDRSNLSPGIVHIGPGAFHRVHQAWYAEQWLATDPRWGITAVSLRSRTLRDALRVQDWLYALAILDEQESFEIIGSLCGVQVADDSPDVVSSSIAGPATRLVTLTVTEKGYCLDGAGRLDLQHADIRHDLEHPASPRSAIGFLVEGLRLRRDRQLPAVPVLSCDNLAGNGRLLSAAARDFAAQLDPGLAAWIEAEVPFPCTMVDSITPATTPALVQRVTTELGMEDHWPVQRESFVQWVVEEHVAPESPDWARAGVTLTDDVSGYEQAKLRLLNGAHSTLAYVGILRGHGTVADAMRDTALAAFVRDLMRKDVAPTLRPVRGLDIDGYIEAVLRRFSNPAIRHELAQIAWDGSKKLPIRIIGTIEDALAAGAPIERPCVTLAAWMHFVRRRTAEGIALVDPLAERLARLAREQTNGEATNDAGAFLSLNELFPRDLAADVRFRKALARAYGRLAAVPAAILT